MKPKAFGWMFLAWPVIAIATSSMAPPLSANGGGSTPKTDSIKVSKCYYMAGATAMLIKASSSDPTARLFAFLPDGTGLGEIQNGGGSRYGGTVVGYYGPDPGYIYIVSTSGGSSIALTTPFQP